MLNILLTNFNWIVTGLFTFFIFFIFRRTKKLTNENQQLIISNVEKDKVINIQAKVLDASEKIKATDLDVNLERLSDKAE